MVRALAVGAVLALVAGSASAQSVGTSTTATPPSMAQVQAIIPQPANVTPPSESTTPAVGAQSMRYALEDHVHQRISRAAVVTTDSNGAWTVTWSPALPAAPAVLPIAVNAGTQPIICNVTTRTTTTAAGKCWLAQNTVLSLGLVTAGLTLLPFANAAASTSVQVFAIPTTQ